MSSFYVELSSNSSYQYNTVSNFQNKVQLLHPLEGNWEVGMSEISYTKSWKNLIRNCELNIDTMFEDFQPFISRQSAFGYIPVKDEERHGIVRSGYYESIERLCEEILNEMKPFEKYFSSLPEFIYDDVKKLIAIKPGINKENKPTLPRLNRELAQLLGFDFYSIKHPSYNKQNLVLGNRPADITAGINTLYVYCNIVEPQYIGDTRAKLLKTVEIPNDSKYGDQVVIKYENPHYVPVLINDFENIEIDIKDDTNSPIRFMFGRTRVKLHFRPCITLI